MNPKILAIGLAALCVSARGSDLIPVEDFARAPTHSDMQLSADGRTLASLRAVEGRNFIEFADLETGSAKKFDPGVIEGYGPAGSERSDLRSVLRYYWLGSKRVLVEVTDGLVAIDRDGKNSSNIAGAIAAVEQNPLVAQRTKEYLVARRVIHPFGDDVHVLMEKHPRGGVTIGRYPDAIKMDTVRGSYERVVTNPGEVDRWIADENGVVRLGVRQISPDEQSVLFRDDEKGSWRPLAGFPDGNNARFVLHGFGKSGRGIYVATRNSDGFQTLHLFDLASSKLAAALFAEPGFDVGSPGSLIWSGDKKTVLGCVYETDGPHIRCFDEDFARHLAAINNRLSETFNEPVSISADGRRILILARSDRHPGAYYLYTTDSGKLEPVLRPRPWITPERMASMNPISYATRDGQTIRGYLTIPVGQKPRNLPMVVLPHDSPFVSRDKWGFDPLVQMLANRGYAVLQMNYRGSAGYGETFLKSGERQGAEAIQADIEDGVRWAVAKKVADPARIAILGRGGFAGFSAVHALANNPGLFRCGISVSGFLDLLDIHANLSGRRQDDYAHAMSKLFGDPKKEKQRLAAISPLNNAEKISSPVLFVCRKNRPLHALADQDVLQIQVERMVAKLGKGGVEANVLFYDHEPHTEEKSQIERFKAIEAFLAKHLGPAGTESPSAPAKAANP